MLGLGVYRPERVVTNDEICEVLDSSDEWIQSRSGIRTRRFAGPDESLIDMATSAAERALAVAGVTADQVGCVIVATSTHPEHTPASAPQVATRLGSTAAAFDVSAGCAGFCHGLNLASSMVRSGAETHVLVIGVEQLSRFMDPTDRGTAFIFADGAGAVVVGPADATGIGTPTSGPRWSIPSRSRCSFCQRTHIHSPPITTTTAASTPTTIQAMRRVDAPMLDARPVEGQTDEPAQQDEDGVPGRRAHAAHRALGDERPGHQRRPERGPQEQQGADDAGEPRPGEDRAPLRRLGHVDARRVDLDLPFVANPGHRHRRTLSGRR